MGNIDSNLGEKQSHSDCWSGSEAWERAIQKDTSDKMPNEFEHIEKTFTYMRKSSHLDY